MTSKKDDNFVSTLTAVLNSNGVTIMNVGANPTTHLLNVSDGTTGSDLGPTNALKDTNNVSTLLGTSYVDGFTPVSIYADINGNLLVDSTTL
jgi:hypothetical protein